MLQQAIDNHDFTWVCDLLKESHDATSLVRENNALARAVSLNHAGIIQKLFPYESQQTIIAILSDQIQQQELIQFNVGLSVLIATMARYPMHYQNALDRELVNATQREEASELMLLLLTTVLYSEDTLFSALEVAVRQSNLKNVELLIIHGADATHNNSVLLIAAHEVNAMKCMQALLRNGADIKARGAELLRSANNEFRDEWLPFLLSHGAADSEEGHTEARRILRHYLRHDNYEWYLCRFAGPRDVNWARVDILAVPYLLLSPTAMPSENRNRGLLRFIREAARDIAIQIIQHPNFNLGHEYQSLMNEATRTYEIDIMILLLQERGTNRTNWEFMERHSAAFFEVLLQNVFGEISIWMETPDPDMGDTQSLMMHRLPLEHQQIYESYKQARLDAMQPENRNPRLRRRLRHYPEERSTTVFDVVNASGFGYQPAW